MWKLSQVCWVLLCAVPLRLLAAEPQTALDHWAERVHEIRLENGMKFLIYPRGESPIFSAHIRFRAGGIHEEEGKTGLAHFLEHMAFKGTETIGTRDYAKEKPILDTIEKTGDELSQEYRKGDKKNSKQIEKLKEKLKLLHQEEEKYLIKEEFSKRVIENGGNDQNATTSKDMTSYFVSFPAEKLRAWAELEVDRIFRPVFREFYEERDVVLEERRMRVENDPDGQLYQALLRTAFQKSPYRWMTIGSTEDVLGLTVGDLRSFWQRYYRPSNAVGVLVGKLDLRETEKILQETFGRVPVGQEETIKTDFLQEPVQSEERHVTLSLEANPRLWLAYHKPTLPERDDYVFDLLDQILGNGRSSRLFKRLVLQERLASGVDTSTGVPGSSLPNLFMIEVEPYPGKKPEEVLRVVEEELEKIRLEGVTDRELEKAKNRLMMDMLWQIQTNEGLASQLSYFEALTGDWRYLRTYLDEIRRMTSDDIRRVVGQYLQKDQRTIAEIR